MVEGKVVLEGCQAEHSAVGGPGSAAAGRHSTGSLESGQDDLEHLGGVVQLDEPMMVAEPGV